MKRGRPRRRLATPDPKGLVLGPTFGDTRVSVIYFGLGAMQKALEPPPGGHCTAFCFRALLSRTTSGVLSCAPRTRESGDTPAVVPITNTHHKRHLRAQYGRRSEPGCVSAAAAAACMSAGCTGGRVWWWAVSRSRTPTTRCRAGAYATGITPGVCVRALDVHGRGCAGDGLLQRRDDRRKRTHERKAGPAE